MKDTKEKKTIGILAQKYIKKVDYVFPLKGLENQMSFEIRRFARWLQKNKHLIK